MLDELLDLDREGGRRNAAPGPRRRGFRGLLDRLTGAFGDGDHDDDQGGRRRYDGDEDEPRDRRRRRDDGLDFGDD
ncbi:MAG: hypothetical protein ACKVT1_11815 [Dehalococcoidia bacterium]